MENNDNVSVNEPTVSRGRKFLLELKEFGIDFVFPFMLMLVVSSSVLLYADYTEDMVVSLVALIGGEAMLAVCLVSFGKANGGDAYKKTALNAQKRSLGSVDEKVACRTGEYALWKGIVIGVALCVPFIVFQTIELCVHTTFCSFCLKYICGWAYFPFAPLGTAYMGLNYIWILLPVVCHTVGYHLGKLRQKKLLEEMAANNGKRKKKGKRDDN